MLLPAINRSKLTFDPKPEHFRSSAAWHNFPPKIHNPKTADKVNY